MRIKLLPISILVASFINISFASPIKSEVIATPNSQEQATAYWTPERLRNATAMDLPRVNARKLKEVRYIPHKNDSEGVDSIPPAIEINPSTHQLFTPIDSKLDSKSSVTNSLDTGILNQYFSSSRLVPTTANTLFPYRTIGKLFFTTPSGDKTCTASVIGKRVLLTAGHCLHNGNGAETGWYTNFKFIPAYNNGTAPYQTWTTTKSFVSTEWYSGGGSIPNQADYGTLEVADQLVNGTMQSIGNVTGTLGWRTNGSFPNQVHILGFSNNLDSGNMIHQVTAQSARTVDANNVEYGSDLSVGAGGSPWIQNFGFDAVGQKPGSAGAHNKVVGLSAYAYNDTISYSNGGSMFDSRFATLVNKTCTNQAGNC